MYRNKTNTESSNFEKLAVAKGTTNHMEVVWLELVLVLTLGWSENKTKFQQPYQNSVVVITNSHLQKLHPHWLRIYRKFLITKVFISNPYNELLWATIYSTAHCWVLLCCAHKVMFIKLNYLVIPTLLITSKVRSVNSIFIGTCVLPSARGLNLARNLSTHSLKEGTRPFRFLCDCGCSLEPHIPLNTLLFVVANYHNDYKL